MPTAIAPRARSCAARRLTSPSGRRAPAAAHAGRGAQLALPSALALDPGTDLAIATRQLATLLGAGIPLVESLGALTEQVEHARLKSVIGQVRDRVNEGATLADALARAGPFSNLFVSMVRAGETGGALEQVLRRLADYLESQVRTRNRVLSIMLYPIMMMGFAVLVVARSSRWCAADHQLPRAWTMPPSTPADHRLASPGLWGRSRRGVGSAAAAAPHRARPARLKLRRLPVRRVVRLVAISRFTRTLSTLLAGGIPIVRALDVSKHVAANVILGEAVDAARTSLTEGATLAAPLRACGEFPPMVVHMVDVGVRSGALEAMLAKVADTYDEQVETAVTRLTALLEPMLILIMVGIVLFIILATLVPLLELTSAIR
jgi:general secretion pathway protein F